MTFLPLLLALLQGNPAGEPASYDALVERGVTEARLGKTRAAEDAFAQAIARDPDRPEAFVERGGLRFLQKDYGDAVRDLERALALREDPYARDLLAASLHLLGRTEDALASWNRLGGPRLGTLEITGLRYTKDEVARREVKVRPGEALDLDELRESRRRLEETLVFERVTFRPQPRGDGTADLELALLERHGFASGTTELLAATAAQLADRRIGLRYANIGGRGASVGGSWRFAEGRPEIALGLDWARPLGLDANLHLAARRGRQGYLLEEPVERESRGMDVAFRRVLGARTTAEMGFSFRRREFSAVSPSAPPGVVAGPQLGLERRLFEGGGHRLDANARVFGALPAVGSDLSFARGVVALRYERARRGDPERESFAARVLFGTGTDGLPLDEGFAPGGGPESPFPLRAHRQFEDGVAGTTPLGRSLFLANLEWRRTLVSRGPLRLGAVVFYDTAHASRGLDPNRFYHDVGAGIRIGLDGAIVRIDWGHGLVDGANALTLGVGHAF
jgi:tetratricopeptide (TPR) repeat protein